ncbi:MAG: glutamate-1-semialdehyde 2,1-aminomutase [Bdellovibrionales bacterium]
MDFQTRLLKAIPGGAHTYSRGFDQFPQNAPQILSRGKGCYVYDDKDQAYLDFGMGLRSVTIGYAEERINQAAFREMEKGNTLTRATMVELEAAEKFLDLIEAADMVKFAKNGSCATTAAVKLARAYTGRKIIARCRQPFFSFDDWFIGSTDMAHGIPDEAKSLTQQFGYNDLASLKELEAKHPGQIACVILEPVTSEKPKEGFLESLREFCTQKGIVLIFDEMITGFRWHLGGAQKYFGIKPDLSTFGKGIANGFPLAAVAGKREIMQLGSTEIPGQERLFLLSSTHGSDMASFGAFLETIKFMEEHKVVEELWNFGEKFFALFNRQIEANKLKDFFKIEGYHCSPYFVTKDRDGQVSLPLRTVFLQEMVKSQVLIPWVALCYRHKDIDLTKLEEAVSKSLKVYVKALEDGVEKHLLGPAVKPVFRRYN